MNFCLLQLPEELKWLARVQWALWDSYTACIKSNLNEQSEKVHCKHREIENHFIRAPFPLQTPRVVVSTLKFWTHWIKSFLFVCNDVHMYYAGTQSCFTILYRAIQTLITNVSFMAATFISPPTNAVGGTGAVVNVVTCCWNEWQTQIASAY